MGSFVIYILRLSTIASKMEYHGKALERMGL